MVRMADSNAWIKSLRGGSSPTGQGGDTLKNLNTIRSPLQTSKSSQGRSPNRAKAPVVRRTAKDNANKSRLMRKGRTTVFMEGREEQIEIHLPLQVPKFTWRVNNDKAYFELGDPSANDDMYTMNITIISGTYLHLLGPDQSHNMENHKWTIQYKCFECDISSDSFQLSREESTRRTYIGDKATAKIRASGGLFCEFLTHTTLEFQAVIQPMVGGAERVVGIGCLDLKELIQPDTHELKYILEMISPDGDMPESDSSVEKPEIRVLVQLVTEPNFFPEPPTPKKEEAEEDARVEITEMGEQNQSSPPEQINKSEESPLPPLPPLQPPPSKSHQKVRFVDVIDSAVLTSDQGMDESTQNSDEDNEANLRVVEEEEGKERQTESDIDTPWSMGMLVKDLQSGKKNYTVYDRPVPEPEGSHPKLPSSLPPSPKMKTTRNLGSAASHTPARAQAIMERGDSAGNGEKELRRNTLKRLQEKEKAYLRILSEEWMKRDQERESVVFEKLKGLEAREKELSKLTKHNLKKEAKLKTFESEMRASTIKTTTEYGQALEDAKFRIHQLEKIHKHEVEILKRSYADAIFESDKLRGRILILENKLKVKEEEMYEAMRSRSKWPENETNMKLHELEKKNESLINQLKLTENERDKYKKEAGALCKILKLKQRELDARLIKENENLKVQLLVNEQRKEMKEERQTVKELREVIKKQLEKTDVPSKPGGREITLSSREGNFSPRRARQIPRDTCNRPAEQDQENDKEFIEMEIARLVEERGCLLASGAYTHYDIIIRNIDNQITKLASRLDCL